MHIFDVSTIIMHNFEYLVIKTVGVTDYTSQTPINISDEKMSKLNTLQKWENIYQMCTK